MHTSLQSILHRHKIMLQRLWHLLTILLVLVSNFGSLVTPAQAKATTKNPANILISQPLNTIKSPAPARIAQPRLDVVKDVPQSANSTSPTIGWSIYCGAGCPSGSSTLGQVTETNWHYRWVANTARFIIMCSSSIAYSFNFCPKTVRLFYNINVVYKWKVCEIFTCPPTTNGAAGVLKLYHSNELVATHTAGCGSGRAGGCTINVSGSFDLKIGFTGGNYFDDWYGTRSPYTFGFVDEISTSHPWLWGNPDMYTTDVNLSLNPIIHNESTYCPTCGNYSQSQRFLNNAINR